MNIWHCLFLQNLKQLITETFLKKLVATELIGQAYIMFENLERERRVDECRGEKRSGEDSREKLLSSTLF